MTVAAGAIAGATASGAIGKRGATTGATIAGATGIATGDPDGVAMTVGRIAMVDRATGSGPIATDDRIAMGSRATGSARTGMEGRAIMSVRAPAATMIAAGGMAGADAAAMTPFVPRNARVRKRASHGRSPA
tara:strand:- start:222 stop:617 length:396 start_codon:yes stop_codon:yes gene_type:complete